METIHYDIETTPRREVLDPSVCSVTIDHDFETSADYTFIIRVRTRDAVLRRDLFRALGPLWFRCYADPANISPTRVEYTDDGATITLPNFFIDEEFVEFLLSHAAFTNTLRDALEDKRGALWNLLNSSECVGYAALYGGIKLINDAITFLDAISMFLDAEEPSAVYDDLNAMVADLDVCTFPYIVFVP
jgi:hypothetical protein